jgi:hypothetical protein
MRSKVAHSALSALIVSMAMLAPGTATFSLARAAETNLVVDWNQTMLSTFSAANVPPPPGNRLGAIVQTAVFDAVNGIERQYTAIHVQPAAPREASPQAAAVNAAYTSLVALFPAQKPALDAALATSLAGLQDEDGNSESISRGLTWGKTVADQILAWRAADGFSATAPPYVFGTAPGDWQATPGGSGPPKFRQLATTTPFALTTPSQFRPAGPPSLNSARYTADFNEVKAVGGQVSSVRTPYQTETAKFWQLDTPTAMWDRVADSLALKHHLNLLRSARLLALVDISIADATFAIWDAKNAFNSWRPVTAIANAALDGNPSTSPDPTWLPLLVTPYFQEYPSAHSGVSSTAASILASVFGANTEFTVTSDGLPGVSRSFDTFAEAVAQVADARVLAGFHFRFSCDDAVVLGGKVAANVEATLMQRARGDDNGADE